MRLLLLLMGALLVLGIVGGLAEHRKRTALESRIDSMQVENAALRGQRIPHTDTVYRLQRDTLKLTRTRTDSLLTTDTLWRTDTVRALLASERASCDAVIATCEVRVAQRDTALARADTISWVKDTVIALLKKPCTYLGIGGPCPALSVFGGIAQSGAVAGIGVSVPVKQLHLRF